MHLHEASEERIQQFMSGNQGTLYAVSHPGWGVFMLNSKTFTNRSIENVMRKVGKHIRKNISRQTQPKKQLMLTHFFAYGLEVLREQEMHDHLKETGEPCLIVSPKEKVPSYSDYLAQFERPNMIVAQSSTEQQGFIGRGKRKLKELCEDVRRVRLYGGQINKCLRHVEYNLRGRHDDVAIYTDVSGVQICPFGEVCATNKVESSTQDARDPLTFNIAFGRIVGETKDFKPLLEAQGKTLQKQLEIYEQFSLTPQIDELRAMMTRLHKDIEHSPLRSYPISPLATGQVAVLDLAQRVSQ